MSEPIVNQPNLYCDNLQIARASNTTLTIAAGACRDATNVYDIVVPSALTLNMANNGANGLDTGAIAASTMYNIFVIMDITGFLSPACLASTSLNPVMPFGYGAKRLIGYIATDGSSHFQVGYWFGNHNERLFMYDAPIATPITAGNSAAYAAVDMSNIVPAVANLPVLVQTNYTANAAADVLKMQPVNGTGDAVTIIAQVAGATAHLVNVNEVMAQLATGKPEINYKVSAGTVAIDVAGYRYSI